MQDKEELHNLYSELIKRRDKVAKNAGFANYRDYKFVELGRFDYTKEDCFRFHEAVKLHVLPLVEKIYKHKKEKLGVDPLRPWDIEAQPAGIEPLILLKQEQNCLAKTEAMFYANASLLCRLFAQDG